MNTRDLEYFQQLYLQKSFTLVANHYHVSQPTISFAIKRLEEHFQTPLVIRDQSHKKLIFTPAGDQLEKHIDVILNELAVVDKELEQFRNEKIRLGLPPIIGHYYFPKLAAQLMEKSLMPNLATTESGSSRLLTLLKNGSLDLAVLGSMDPLNNDGLTSTILTKKQFKIIVSPNHPLATKEKISFSDLKDDKFVMLKEGFVHPKAFRWLSQQANVKPDVIYQTNDVSIIKSMVKEQVGIGFLTELAIDSDDQLAVLDIDADQIPQFLVSIVMRQSHLLTPLQRTLIQELEQL